MNINYIRVRDDAKVPDRATNFAIGYDVFASIVLDKVTNKVIGELPVEILPRESALIGIGVQFAIPWLWRCEVVPRSGLAARYGIAILNSPGTIDPDFRGEAGVLLMNQGENPFTVEKDMRIA